MSNEVIKAETFGLEAVQLETMTTGLEITRAERSLLKVEFMKLSTVEVNSQTVPLFKALRMKIVRNRTQGTDKWHSNGKLVSLRTGQLYDAIRKNENEDNFQMETILQNAEQKQENEEKARIAAIQNERVLLVSAYLEDADQRDLSSMEIDVWEMFLFTKKKAYEDRLAAEAKAKQEQIAKEAAEAFERQRVIDENARLKAEAQILKDRNEEMLPYAQHISKYNNMLAYPETEYQIELAKVKAAVELIEAAQIQAEKDRMAAQAKAKEQDEKRRGEMLPYIQYIREYQKMLELPEEEYQIALAENKEAAVQHFRFQQEVKEEQKAEIKKQRLEQEEKDRLAKIVSDQKEEDLASLRAQHARIQLQEDEKRKKFQAKIQADENAKIQAEADRQAQIQLELSKGDAEKVTDLLSDLENLKVEYEFESEANKKMYLGVQNLLLKIQTYISK